MNKKEKEARRHQEDQALNRGLCWAGGAIVLELILILIKRYYFNFTNSSFEIHLAQGIQSVLRVIWIGGPLVVLAGLIWLFLSVKKQKRTALPVILTVVVLVLSVCAHVILMFQKNGVQMLFILVPVLAGLALVYYIYQKEFFLAALGAGLSVLGMWFIRYRDGFCLESVVVLIGILVVLAATLSLKKKGGLLAGAAFLPKDACYKPILASVGVGLAALLISMIAGSAAAYYLIFLMIAWLFALLVYFTVKLM